MTFKKKNQKEKEKKHFFFKEQLKVFTVFG